MKKSTSDSDYIEKLLEFDFAIEEFANRVRCGNPEAVAAVNAFKAIQFFDIDLIGYPNPPQRESKKVRIVLEAYIMV